MNQTGSNIRKTLGARIRQERLRKNLTIEKLAEILDVSPSFLGCVERGERALSIENLCKISDILEVTIDSLVKSNTSAASRAEELSLLLKELNENEYRSVYEIARTATYFLKNHGKQD